MEKPQRLPYQQLNEDSLQVQSEEGPIGAIHGNPGNTPQPYPQITGNQLQQQYTQPSTTPIEQTLGHIVHVKLARNLGITQVVIGTLCFFIEIILLILSFPGKSCPLLNPGSFIGIWGGVLISIAGMLSICSAHVPTRYRIKCAALTMNIFSVLIAFCGMGLLYIDIGIIDNNCYNTYPYSYNPQPYPTYYPDYYYPSHGQDITVIQNLTIVLTLLMSMEFIIGILSAIVTGCGCPCCRCCSEPGEDTQQMTYISTARPISPSSSTIYQPHPPSTTVVGNQPPPYHNSQLPLATTPLPPLGSVNEPGISRQENAPPQTF